MESRVKTIVDALGNKGHSIGTWEEEHAKLTHPKFVADIKRMLDAVEIWPFDSAERTDACISIFRCILVNPSFMACQPSFRSATVDKFVEVSTLVRLMTYPHLKSAINDVMEMLQIYQTHPSWKFGVGRAKYADICRTDEIIRNWISVDVFVKAAHDKEVAEAKAVADAEAIAVAKAEKAKLENGIAGWAAGSRANTVPRGRTPKLAVVTRVQPPKQSYKPIYSYLIMRRVFSPDHY